MFFNRLAKYWCNEAGGLIYSLHLWCGSRSSYLAEIIRGGGWVVFAQSLGVPLGLILHLLLAHWLGAVGYGIYGVVTSVATIVALPAMLGLDQAGLRVIPEFKVTHQSSRPFVIYALRVAFFGGLGAGLVVALAGVFLSIVSSPYSSALTAAAGLAVCFPAIAFGKVVARAYRRPAIAILPSDVYRPAIMIFLIAILVVTGVSNDVRWALAAATLSATTMLVFYIAFIRRHCGESSVAAPTDLKREWRHLGYPLLGIAAAGLANSQVGLLLVGAWLGPAEAGVYLAAIKLAALVSITLVATNLISAPIFAELYTAGRHDELRSVVAKCARLIFWPALGLSLILVGFSSRLLLFLGEEYASAYPILVVLIVGQLFNAASGPVSYLSQMTGDQQGALVAITVSTVLNICMTAILIVSMGLLGAAVSSAVSIVVWNFWLRRRVIQRLKFSPSIY